MNDWLRIAHRGASGHAPENTLASFQMALEIGVDGVEMDARLTADGHVVVMHDETLDRTTDMEGRVDELTLSEIKRADAGGGERVPTLQEALSMIPSGVLAVVEIKAVEAAGPSARIASDLGKSAETVAISFLPAALPAVRAADAGIQTGLIVGQRLVEGEAENGLAMLKAARAVGTSAVSCNWRAASPDAVQAIHNAGGTVGVWTPNDPRHIRQAVQAGADAVTSDYPDRLNDARAAD